MKLTNLRMAAMLRTFLLLTVFSLLQCNGFAQSIPPDSLYLGQIPPGNSPIVFQLPVSSGLRPVERIAISSDGREVYYGELNAWVSSPIQRIKCFKYIDNIWQGPFIVFEGFIAPALSGNDSILYIQKNLNGVPTTFYSIRNEAGWSNPTRLLSTNLQTHYFRETLLKNYYLASTPTGNSDICMLKIHNSDTLIQSLGKPINTPEIENDFFIARDESFIIFFRLVSPFNLFISYNKGNGKWTNPKSLGININTSIYECCPFVTNDNKYLFFTRGGSSMPSYYTYWVKVDELIDSLQYTNFVPYLNNLIPNQVDSIGQFFSFTIPDSTFIDDDGNNTLSYSAKLNNGNSLPVWLIFDSISHNFSGTPTNIETLNIRVTVTDTIGATASTTFIIEIKNPGAIDQIKRQDVSIFPNPSNGLINISPGILSGKSANIKIFNLQGQVILSDTYFNISETTIDLGDNPKGIYILSFNIDGEILNKKICLK